MIHFQIFISCFWNCSDLRNGWLGEERRFGWIGFICTKILKEVGRRKIRVVI